MLVGGSSSGVRKEGGLMTWLVVERTNDRPASQDFHNDTLVSVDSTDTFEG